MSPLFPPSLPPSTGSSLPPTPDGEWDWDNYSVVYLSQRKDLPVTAMASVKFNVWCAIGNSIHVIHSHLLKMEVRTLELYCTADIYDPLSKWGHLYMMKKTQEYF